MLTAVSRQRQLSQLWPQLSVLYLSWYYCVGFLCITLPQPKPNYDTHQS